MIIDGKGFRMSRNEILATLSNMSAENIDKLQALSILGSYMSSTAVSPLMSQLVEIAEPFATGLTSFIHFKRSNEFTGLHLILFQL